jgi:quinol monooxygenase YgiN
MVYVLASIRVKPGQRAAFLEIFLANVPNVLAEQGCLRYAPTVDVDSGIGAQEGPRENVVTIVEQWENLDRLHAHLDAPHMAAYREKVKDLVEGVTLHVTEPAH